MYINEYIFQLPVNLRDNKEWHGTAVQIRDIKWSCVAVVFYCERQLIVRFKT